MSGLIFLSFSKVINYHVLSRYCAMEDAWSSLAPLENSRRHHSLVRLENKIYLIGGFGKHRIILNTVEVLDTVSGEVTQCDNLPVPLYGAAATHFGGRIYVFGQLMVCYLEPGVIDTWRKIENIEMPRNAKFSTALSSKTHVYLTSTHFHELYRYFYHLNSITHRMDFSCSLLGLIPIQPMI